MVFLSVAIISVVSNLRFRDDSSVYTTVSIDDAPLQTSAIAIATTKTVTTIMAASNNSTILKEWRKKRVETDIFNN